MYFPPMLNKLVIVVERGDANGVITLTPGTITGYNVAATKDGERQEIVVHRRDGVTVYAAPESVFESDPRYGVLGLDSRVTMLLATANAPTTEPAS